MSVSVSPGAVSVCWAHLSVTSKFVRSLQHPALGRPSSADFSFLRERRGLSPPILGPVCAAPTASPPLSLVIGWRRAQRAGPGGPWVGVGGFHGKGSADLRPSGGKPLGPSPDTLPPSSEIDVVALWLCRASPHEAPLSRSLMEPSPALGRGAPAPHCADAEPEGRSCVVAGHAGAGVLTQRGRTASETPARSAACSRGFLCPLSLYSFPVLVSGLVCGEAVTVVISKLRPVSAVLSSAGGGA